MKKEIVCVYAVTLSLRGNRNCQVGWCHGSECVGGLKWSETDYTIFTVTFQWKNLKPKENHVFYIKYHISNYFSAFSNTIQTFLPKTEYAAVDRRLWKAIPDLRSKVLHLFGIAWHHTRHNSWQQRPTLFNEVENWCTEALVQHESLFDSNSIQTNTG